MEEQAEKEKVIEDGIRLSSQLRDYIDILEREFNHKDMPRRLQALALNGLKLTTGRSIEELKSISDEWKRNIEDCSGGNDTAVLRDKSEEWIEVLEKLLRFVNLVPAEAKRILPTQQTDKDIDSYFSGDSHLLIQECIDWFRNFSGKQKNPETVSVRGTLSNSSSLGMINPSSAALELICLKKSYVSRIVLNEINLKVAQGECFGLLGPNGAGKTTLIECLEGIRQFDSGAVTVLGHRLEPNKTGLPRSLRSILGVQVQFTGFYPLLTVGETIRLFAGLYRSVPSFFELMERLDLWQIEKTRVQHLSGGQFQRLSLAIALLHDPRLVFLDEPTTGLDPSVKRMLWDVILEFRRKGRTVFLTTHDMAEAEHLCSRVAIMAGGKIIQEGVPAQLISEYIGERTIELTVHGTVTREEIAILPGVKSYWTVESKVVMNSTDERATLSALCDVSFANGKVEGIIVRKGSLEDVFLKLTKGKMA